VIVADEAVAQRTPRAINERIGDVGMEARRDDREASPSQSGFAVSPRAVGLHDADDFVEHVP